jgi:anti-anti-sigma regulatory factor
MGVSMSAIALFHIQQERVVPALQEASDSIDRAQGEAVLDFSTVRRIDLGALRALQDFARVADEKAVKIVLRGVNVDVYKVLKLVKLTQKFAFVNCEAALAGERLENCRAQPSSE